jgi:hypothetical protein
MTDRDVKFGENLATANLVIKQLGHAATPAKALVEGAG